jgi:hypothetical protein
MAAYGIDHKHGIFIAKQHLEHFKLPFRFFYK